MFHGKAACVFASGDNISNGNMSENDPNGPQWYYALSLEKGLWLMAAKLMWPILLHILQSQKTASVQFNQNILRKDI